MGYYRINTLTNCAKKYGSFLNDYEPYQEIREFRHYENKFVGFSNTPIIFERDKSYKNDEPISDFLLNDWSEIIVSERIYKMLKEKYSDELDFYECFAKDNDQLLTYYILRPKHEIDYIDEECSTMIDYGVTKVAFKTVLKDNINEKYNYFVVKMGASNNVISERLYKDLKALNPTNFEVSRIFTRSEHLNAKEKLTKKHNK